MKKTEFHKRLKRVTHIVARIKQEAESGHALEARYIAQETRVARQFNALLNDILDRLPGPVVESAETGVL